MFSAEKFADRRIGNCPFLTLRELAVRSETVLVIVRRRDDQPGSCPMEQRTLNSKRQYNELPLSGLTKIGATDGSRVKPE